MCRLRAGYRQTRHNFAPVSDRTVYNVVRLNAFPDGGIARLNVYGHACPVWDNDSMGEVRPGAEAGEERARETEGPRLGEGRR